jgi:hypothetical protein
VSAKKPAQTRAGSSAAKPRGRPFEPGNTHAWKPGQSGNPSGLPKNRIETAAYIEQRLREEYLEQLVTALALHAIKGSPTHIVEALNRVAGKVIDKAELALDANVSMKDDAIKLARELLNNDSAREHIEAATRSLVGGGVADEPGAVRDEAEPGALED